MCVCSVVQSCPTLCSPTRLLCPWNFPGKNSGAGYHFIFQGIFPIQGLNLHLLHLLHWYIDSLPLWNKIHCTESLLCVLYVIKTDYHFAPDVSSEKFWLMDKFIWKDFLYFFYWRVIALQNFTVFCQTSTWISHRHTYISSLLNLLPVSLPTPPI